MVSGFARALKKQEHELKSYEDLENWLRSEFIHIEKVKADLDLELKDINALEEKFKILESECLALITLFKKWDFHNEKLSELSLDEPLNIAECDNQIQMIQRLNSEINQRSEVVFSHFSDFLLKESHLLYLEEKNRKRVEEISNKSKFYLGKIKHKNKHILATIGPLNQFTNRLKRKKLEQSY